MGDAWLEPTLPLPIDSKLGKDEARRLSFTFAGGIMMCSSFCSSKTDISMFGMVAEFGGLKHENLICEAISWKLSILFIKITINTRCTKKRKTDIERNQTCL